MTVGRRGGTRTEDTDEHPRPNLAMAALAKLEPLYSGGVTIGNGSVVNDGAAVVIVGSGAADRIPLTARATTCPEAPGNLDGEARPGAHIDHVLV